MTTASARTSAPSPTGSHRVPTARLEELAHRVTTTGGERERITVEKPATGEPLATVPRCTSEDVAAAADADRGPRHRRPAPVEPAITVGLRLLRLVPRFR